MQQDLFGERRAEPAPPYGSFRTTSPDDEVIRHFQSCILAYYAAKGRRFPWRETRDPFLILVSEIMLQQTQTDRVAKKWGPFISRFPDVDSMAAAPFPEILELWRGMGYNRRARALKDISMRIVDEFDGEVPDDVGILTTFPMIGVSTASAICAFAFDAPTVFIETNIRRVFLHFFFQEEEKVTDREILPITEQTIVERDPRIWYYALMDYGVFLKKNLPNQNKRSAHYARQPTFKNSDRQLRGMILRTIMTDKTATIDYLTSALSFEETRVRKCAYNLVEEGMLVCEDQIFRLSE